jgi:hypothetical protein
MNLATSSLLWGIHTAQIFPTEVVGTIRVTEISRVEDVDIPFVEDLPCIRSTLFAGLEKKSSQHSVWSKASGKLIDVQEGVVASKARIIIFGGEKLNGSYLSPAVSIFARSKRH